MRIMRLVVMFDLPTKTKADKDNYIKFKRFLDDDGYQREQNSVYSRNLLSRSSSEAHAEQLRKHLPPARACRRHGVHGKAICRPESSRQHESV